MTVLATTSPGFGRYGRVPKKLAELGWEFIRCVDAGQPDGGLGAHLARVDFLVAGLVPVDAATLAGAPRLKAVLKHGVGVDSIDIAACTAHGVPVLNTPGANANAVAELAVAMLFALARNLPAAHGAMLAKTWARTVGSEIAGKTLGIVGLGNIGKLLALKASGLGMRVLAADLYPDTAYAKAHGIALVDLDTLLGRADYVSLHVFGGGGALITAEKLALMREGACLLNLARGEVLDLDAANAALSAGRLGGIALDAYPVEPPDFAHPIFAQPRAIFTPHTGADTLEAVENVGLMNIADIEELLAGGRPARTLNPEVFK